MKAQVSPQMTQIHADRGPARIAAVPIARIGRMDGGGGGMLRLHRGRRAQPFQGWGPGVTGTQGRPAAGQPWALMRNPLGVLGGRRRAIASEREDGRGREEVSGALPNAATGDRRAGDCAPYRQGRRRFVTLVTFCEGLFGRSTPRKRSKRRGRITGINGIRSRGRFRQLSREKK